MKSIETPRFVLVSWRSLSESALYFVLEKNMTNLLKCNPIQLDKVIRDAVVTNPWSDVDNFPDMKRTTVIRSGGFSNSDGAARVVIEEETDQDEESIFKSKKDEMQKHGLRLITGLIDAILIQCCGL